MKYLVLVFLSWFFVQAIASGEQSENILKAPDTWRTERIHFPLGFAPTLDYQGFEDIRFAPGWSDEQAEDFWSYAFVWYLDTDPKLNKEILEQQIKAYFDGLMKSTDTSVAVESKAGGHQYVGYASVVDAFFTKEKMVLNFTVVSSVCTATGKHAVLFRLSPQARSHSVWNALNKVDLAINCS